VVHGFASFIGGCFDIPHGVICGTLLSEVTRQNIESLITRNPDSLAVIKYFQAALLLDPSCPFKDPVEGCRHLVTVLDDLTDHLQIPVLGDYGVTRQDIDSIAGTTGQKNNPVQLSTQALTRIL